MENKKEQLKTIFLQVHSQGHKSEIEPVLICPEILVRDLLIQLGLSNYKLSKATILINPAASLYELVKNGDVLIAFMDFEGER